MTDSARPIVSVVIPTLNRARFLPDALDSIVQQRVDGVETIVVDDGSTDNTESVISAYGHGVQYMRQGHRGTAAARNAGIARAIGRFISFLDSDDVWLPGKVAAELAVFERHPEIDAVISDSERWLGDRLICRSWLEDRGLVVRGDAPTPLLPVHLQQGKIFATCSLTIRRETLDKIGLPLFDTSLETHEDLDFAIRMQHCCSIMVLPKIFARVRRFDDGSRVGRPVPGTEYPPEVKRVHASRRYRVFERALRLRWPDGAKSYLNAARTDAAYEFADNVVGWWPTGLGSLVVAELRHAAFGSAFAIALRGLMPEKGRALLPPLRR
jgi:glycosyltransferase involved in cell wall biosynthesis